MPELTEKLHLTQIPDQKLIVVSARSNKLVVWRKFQPTYLLLMSCEGVEWSTQFLPHVKKSNQLIAWPADKHVLLPVQRPYPMRVDGLIWNHFIFLNICYKDLPVWIGYGLMESGIIERLWTYIRREFKVIVEEVICIYIAQVEVLGDFIV